MPATYGTGKQRIAVLPLALMLVLHLMLALLWVTNAGTQIDQGTRQRNFTVTWLPALRPRVPPVPAPAPAIEKPARMAKPQAAPASSAPQLVPPTVAVEPPQSNAASPASTPDAVDVNQMIEAAKRQGGAIDRELRAGKLAALAPDPDLPVTRLRTGLESAYIDRSRSLVTESYTQADGVIVYRFRQGGKVWCRQSGGIGPGMMERSEGAKLAGAGSAGGAGAAGTIQCPSDETGWSRL